MNKLPKKWCIRWDCYDTFKVCNEYFDGRWGYVYNAWIVSDNNNYYGVSNGYPPTNKGYTEITIEQLKDFISNKKSDININLNSIQL